MSYFPPPRRPWVPTHTFSSNSLNGMEIPLRTPSPFSVTLPRSRHPSRSELLEKPLPPTPRKPSSVYSLQNDETTKMRIKTLQNEVPPLDSMLQPMAYRSSTSVVPVNSAARPPLLGNQEGHAVSDPVLERRRAQREDLAELGIHSSQLLNQHPTSDLPAQPKPDSQRSIEPNIHGLGADQHANTYESILDTRSSIIPNFTTEPYFSHAYLPSQMSSRITDVIDHSLVPPPLRYNITTEDTRLSSRFSASSDSSSDIFQSSIRETLRTYARKVFRSRKPPVPAKRKKTVETKHSLDSTFLNSRRRGSGAGQRRTSIQMGLSHMYTSLRKLSIPSSSPKVSGTTKKTRLPRELRSPAIPITSYQKIGTKAWEKSAKSRKRSRPESATSTQFLFPSRKSKSSPTYNYQKGNETPRPASIVNKITTAFHNGSLQVESAMGLNTRKKKRSKAELRREELKKKIVVLGLGEQPAGRGTENRP